MNEELDSIYGTTGDDVITRDHTWIAVNAYYKAEARGIEPGHDQEDWLAAEIEVDDLLKEVS